MLSNVTVKIYLCCLFVFILHISTDNCDVTFFLLFQKNLGSQWWSSVLITSVADYASHRVQTVLNGREQRKVCGSRVQAPAYHAWWLSFEYSFNTVLSPVIESRSHLSSPRYSRITLTGCPSKLPSQYKTCLLHLSPPSKLDRPPIRGSLRPLSSVVMPALTDDQSPESMVIQLYLYTVYCVCSINCIDMA